MKAKFAICTFAAVILTTFHIAEAQQAKKVPRIAFLGSSPSTTADRAEAFRQGLRQLGYVEERNIFIEFCWTEGRNDRFSDPAAELVRLNVDVFVSS
jgi:putative ABC transport system substrate-binding protein